MAPSSAHQLRWPFKTPGFPWSQVPAVTLTGDTALVSVTVALQPCSSQGSRCAQAQGTLLGPSHNLGLHNPKGLWHLERAFFTCWAPRLACESAQ